MQKHPAATPASYPQTQSPTVSNPALWERLAYDSLGTDTLFFAFYYQQVFVYFLYIHFHTYIAPIEYFSGIKCFETFYTSRTHTSSSWQQESWRRILGGTTESTIHGSNVTKNPRSPLTNMRRDHTSTLTTILPRIILDGNKSFLL